jgi:MFS family permease
MRSPTLQSDDGRAAEPAHSADLTVPAQLAQPPAGARLVLALIAGQIGLHAAMAGLRLAATLQALREGYSAWSVGLLLALFAAAPVLLALHAGRMADRHGYHRPMRWAAAMAAGGMLLAVASTRIAGDGHFVLLCLAAMLGGGAANMGVLTIQRAAGLIARDSAHRVQLFSWLGIAPSLANVVGPVAVGLVIDAAGFTAVYVMLVFLPLLSWLAARRVPPIAPSPPTAADDGRTAWELLRAPGIRRLFTINFLLATCWDVHAFAVPILGHERGFSASTIGFILGGFTLSVSVARLLLPMLAHRLVEARVIRWAMLGTAAVFALYPLASTPLLMLGCAGLLGVTLGVAQPMIMSTLHHLTPDHRHGEALALRSMAMNVASTAMPLIFGVSGAWVGVGVLFWLVGAGVGSGAWLTGRLRGVSE